MTLTKPQIAEAISENVGQTSSLIVVFILLSKKRRLHASFYQSVDSEF
jgi:hypothetical protein